MNRPKPGDYTPYYDNYISKVEGNNVLKVLEEQLNNTFKFFNSIPESKGSFSYAEGKWTIKEVIGHIIDTERVFAYRALCIARGEKKHLPGFEQDDYIKEGGFNERKISDLAEEFRKVREANLALFKSFDETAINRRGVASEKEITVNAILFIIAGHENHHAGILKSRYLI
ncbi:MAG: DinB family protein [Bacteroidetes bacterium]|nr:DinB family protein [Bacteroidota bacterium]